MSHRYNRYNPRTPERPRRRNGCLGCSVAGIWILLLGVLAFLFYLKPMVSEQIGSQITDVLAGSEQEQAQQPGQQIREGVERMLPTAIAVLPSGELRVTDGQVNDYLAGNIGALPPLESVTIRFVPGEVQADLRAFGTTSQARMQLIARNGRIAVLNPQIDGPLGQVISLADVTGPLEQQINALLAAQGRRITDVQVQQGVAIIRIDES